MSVGQGLKVVVGAGFSKSEERSLDWRGRRVGWGGCRPGQSWFKLERHNDYCVARANGLPQEAINSRPVARASGWQFGC